MDIFRKYIEKLTTPGRDKAIDYMCDRFNQYYGGDLISREDIKITDINYMGLRSTGDYGLFLETSMKNPESKVNIHFMNFRTNSENFSINVEIGFDSIVTNDKFFEATLMPNNDDDWDEWFVFY